MKPPILTLCAAALALAAGNALAAPRPPPSPQEQKEADRHFKAGVTLFKEGKFAPALAEFEAAYAIAPHPLVLYNIAGCYRELANHPAAVRYYLKFLAEGVGTVPAARLAAAQTELDDLLPRVARITVKVEAVPGAALFVGDTPADPLPLTQPVVVAPGEHKLVARAEGRAPVERTVRVSAGEQIQLDLTFPPLPSPGGGTPGGGTPGGGTPGGGTPGGGTPGGGIGVRVPVPGPAREAKRFVAYAGFGTNALRVSQTGAPAVGLGFAIGSRLELGVDATLVAYAIVPTVRVRLAGTALAIHAIAAAPIALTDGDAMETFVAGAIGVGVRLRATGTLALRLESYASFAGEVHGTTIPTFVGGELWF